ncbi:aldehyde dehydrogenase family protein [Cupriavidus basilensis]
MVSVVDVGSRIKAAESRNLIGGEWVSSVSGETIDVENPATEELIARVPRSGVEDIDRAVRVARATVREPCVEQDAPD